jgi:uncharacterized protein
MSVFVDTSAFLAILNADDRYHQSARDSWMGLIDESVPLFCSSYILVETFAVLENRFGMDAVLLFQNDVVPIFTIFWVDEELHQRAISALITAKRRNLSLVDCASFECMRMSGLRKVFTFDPHFREQGFQVMP